MGFKCCAFGCQNQYQKGKRIGFYGFPLNKPQLLKSWVEAMKCKGFSPSKKHRLCSDHFHFNDIVRKSKIRSILSPNAVPSIFPATLSTCLSLMNKDREFSLEKEEHKLNQNEVETDAASAQEVSMDLMEELELPVFVTVGEGMDDGQFEDDKKTAVLDEDPLNGSSSIKSFVDYKKDTSDFKAREAKLWVFGALEDETFARAVRQLLSSGFRVDSLVLRRQAYQFAEGLALCHSFSPKMEMAGPLFLENFLNRHPTIRLSPNFLLEGAAVRDAGAEGREAFAARVRSRLRALRLQRRPECVWTVCEHTFPMNCEDLPGLCKGYGPGCGSDLVTVVACANAAGTFLPPFLVVPKRALDRDEVCDVEHRTAKVCATKYGGVTQASFLRWLSHFERHRTPSGPCALLATDHAVHKTVDVALQCELRDVHLVAVPSPALAPLCAPSAFVDALLLRYKQARAVVQRLRRRDCGASVSANLDPRSFPGVAVAGHARAARPELAVDGFRDAGIIFSSSASDDDSDESLAVT